MRFAVALLAIVLFIAGPLMPVGWVADHRDGVCGEAAPRAATGWSVSSELVPPSVTCTYPLPDRVLVVRHDAPHKDAAAALMATGLVLAVAAYSARPRRSDEAAPVHG